MTKQVEDPQASSFPSLDDHPLYRSFFEDHGSYERIHIHLLGVRPNIDDDSKNANAVGIRRKRGPLGWGPALIDSVADPYVIAEAVGDDTGGGGLLSGTQDSIRHPEGFSPSLLGRQECPGGEEGQRR